MSHSDGTQTAAELIENKAKNVLLGFMNCVIEKIWFIVLESFIFLPPSPSTLLAIILDTNRIQAL